MVGVSSRTRSKKVPLFSTLSLNRSSSKRKKNDEDVMSLESASGSKRKKVKNQSFVFPKSDEVIFIDEDDYDEEGSKQCDVDVRKEVKGDESGGSCEIGDKNGNFVDDKCGWERENPIIMDLDDEQFVGFEADDEGDDVRKKVKVDESGGSREFGDKNGNFVDDKCGWERENPIIMDSDDEQFVDSKADVRKKVKVNESDEFVDKDVIFVDSDESDEDDDDSDESDESDESEEDETSDEDFNVDEVNEIIENDDDSSSDADDDDDEEEVEEEEEEEEVEEEEEEKEKKSLRKYFNVVEKLAREVSDEQSGEEEEEEEKNKKGSTKSFNVVEELSGEVNDEKNEEEKKKNNKVKEISDSVDGSSNDVDDNEEEVREDEEKKQANAISDVDVGSTNDVIVDEEVVREEEEEKDKKEKKVNAISDIDDGSSNVIIVDEEAVREEEEKDKKEKKVNAISDIDDGSSNVIIVDEEVVREEEEKDKKEKKVNAISDIDDGSSNVIIVDNEEEKVRDEEKKDLRKPNNVGEEEDKEEDLDPLWHERDNCLMEEEEEQLREAKDRKSEISNRNNEKKKIKTGPSVYNNVNVGDSVKGKKKHVKGLGVGGVSSVQTKQEKVKDLDKPTENVKVADSVEGKERQHVKGLGVGRVSSVQIKQEKVKDLDKPTENVKVADSVEGKEQQHVKGLGVGGVSSVQIKQEKVKDLDKPTENVKVGDSVEGKERRHVKGLVVLGVSSVEMKEEKMEDLDEQKMMENKPREDCKGGINIENGVKKEPKDNNGLNRSGKSTHSMPKKLPLAQYLAELYLRNKNDTMKNASSVSEMNDDGVNQKDTRQPPVCVVETPSLRWSLKRVVPKTKEEEELDKELEKNKPLWDEMERAIRESEAESEIGNLGTNRSPSPHCEHITILDEQLGIYCKLCGDVITEMKYISELVFDRYPNEGSRRRATIGGDDVSLIDRSPLNVSDDDDTKANISHTEVTVWDKIPDVKQTLYPHQQEGFEFIWKNLAGSINLQELKNVDPRSEGGCIISHAPGTGKTRLTIVFLKAYLKLFPKCLPIVVAPASLLLTWEEEFKKWDIGVPFHNLSNLELSGKEHSDVFNRFDRFNTRYHTEETRMAKLISWFKETSILGISYSLYGSICQEKEKKKNASVKKSKGNFDDIRKVLLEAPGLLVLDEGHTPRNQRSHIWKVLSKKSQTQKRIILSGTPFQNNFWELYCTLSLVKPSFPNKIPPELKRFCHKQRHKSSEKWGWEQVLGNTARNPSDDDDEIEKLKLLMDPFVHVHKGAILESKLPGLRECLVTLKADSLQNEILKGIKRSQNKIFNFERKIALTSVHPSLFLECDLSKAEESVLDKDQLKQIRLNPHEGVKTKFVYEFVRLCNASNEKVLVFSQFHAPLLLLKDQLNLVFNWSDGEVLFMSSKDPPKIKQSIIHTFNDENSKAKVLLAATKACSEGISLVGASRVVLLDVVWNPSVERQAISRAYRIGQKKVVYTYHLLAEGTSEEEKYGKQAEKDRLSELLFSAKTATDNDDVPKKRAVNFEDSVLDKMTQHEKLIDMFVKCVVLRKERDLV